MDARSLLGERGWKAGPFDLIVDALGVRSPLWRSFGGGKRRDLRYGALWGTLPWPASGFDRHALEQRYERASTMIGVLPIGRRHEDGIEEAAFFWSLRVDDYDAWLHAGACGVERTDRWPCGPTTEPLLDSIHDSGQMTLARYGHHMLARPFGERMVAIGDAFHAASPQLGQGANMALLDARALAPALRSTTDLQRALALYARQRRRQMVYYQALSRGFTPFYQSDSRLLPPLRDFVIAPATRLPVVRRLVAASVAGLVLAPATGNSAA